MVGTGVVCLGSRLMQKSLNSAGYVFLRARSPLAPTTTTLSGASFTIVFGGALDDFLEIGQLSVHYILKIRSDFSRSAVYDRV